MKQKILILSIALNGYQWMYQKELKSQQYYARKYGYVYQAVTRPFISLLGVECCWLKLTLIRTALLSGYDNVLFLDADTMVHPNCPELNKVFQNGKYVYMAKGYSNRFNSGVLIARNHLKTIDWLTCVIDARFNKVRKENYVGWGENGHVIEFSKGVSFIVELDKKWNNTFDNHLKDYIRHRNCGPMRTNYFNILFHKVVFFLSARILTFLNHNQLLDDTKQAKNYN
jgi:lipopolysaccharide biosynthesis glycosyltransferase